VAVRRARRTSVVGAALIAIASFAPRGPLALRLARAEGPAPVAAANVALAKQALAEGLALERTGKCAEAIPRFRSALTAATTAEAAFHLGVCEARTGALVSAIMDLDRAVVLARESQAADIERDADAEADAVRKRAPTLVIAVPPSSRPISARLDGAVVAVAALGAPTPLDPGEHVITVEFPAGQVEKKVRLAERDATRVVVEPPSSAIVAAPIAEAMSNRLEYPEPPARPAPPKEASTGARGNAVGWLFVSGAAVAIGSGALFWALRGAEITKLEAGCPSRTDCDDGLRVHDTRGKVYTTTAVALFGIGAIGGAAGVGILLFGGKDAQTRGTAIVVPSALPGGAAAHLVGAF
jgi:hypothetical protein